MSRRRKSRPAEDAPETVEDVSTGVPTEEVLAEGSEEIEAAIVEAVEALADDEPLPLEADSEVSEESLEAAGSAEVEVEGEGDAEAPVEMLEAADPGEGGEPVEGAEAVTAAEGEEGEIGRAGLPTAAGSMDQVQLKQLVEALIFASDKPLTVQRLRQLTRVADIKRLETTLAEIATDYENRGLILSSVSGGYQFRTRPQFSAWVQQLIAGRPVRLSRAQLETLAIVAYRQPITRPEIDDIRGVDSSATLKLLMDRTLIRILGKKEEVGRPMLYGTTKEFLDFFSLGDLRELPTLREYSELTAESRKVMSDRLGIAPDGSDPSGSDGAGGDGSGGGSDGGGSDGGDGGGFNSGPIDGGGSPMDDGGGMLDASADDLRAAVELSESDSGSDADAVSASDADSVSASDSDSESASDADSVSASDSDSESVSVSASDSVDAVTDSADAVTDSDAEAVSAGDEAASAETREMGSDTGDDEAISAAGSDAEAVSAGDEDVSSETREMGSDADDDEAVAAVGLRPDAELSADGDEGVSAATPAEMSASDEAAPDDGSVQLADGTGAVAAEALDAMEPAEVEVFAEGSSQFAAVTDAQLAEALAETIEPAAEAGDADTMVAAEATEDLERTGSPESTE